MRKIVTAAAVAGAMLVGQSNAAVVNSTFTVTAAVAKTCTVGATNIAFGTYTPGAGALTANSTISVKCTKTTPYTVALNSGSTTGGTFAQRLMGNGAESLQYNLYTSAALTTIYGDGTASTGSGSGTGAGVGLAAQTYTAFGQLVDSVANQNAAPLATNYSDTITVTVTY